MNTATAGPDWPKPPAPEAFHGPLSDLVRTIEPHTEADPVAILVQGLVAFGNVIGRGPHFTVESDIHHMNLFCVLVGATSKARKGTSWGHIFRRLVSIDPKWRDCVKSGLSSGEGLIWAVRDDAPSSGYTGVADKRLLILEGEFSSVLRVLGREGNTLSAQVRQAWDSGDLQVLTRNCPVAASGAHISLVSHITRPELLRYLTSTEAGNGFANRFLWICARRSKTLPEGGCVGQLDFTGIDERLQKAVKFARDAGEIKRDELARSFWRDVYPALSDGRAGLLGAVTSRAEAQVMRLACIYALLDLSNVVQEEHLKAALALWRYCDDSVRFIFGDALGDPIADELLQALRAHPTGLTRTDISNFFARHVRSAQIDGALALLDELGQVRCETVPTEGRPTKRWRASPDAQKAQ